MNRVILPLAALGLSACAAVGPQLSASQCAADWGAVGYADGLDGAPEGKIEQYRRACAGSGPLAESDIDAWRAGWADAQGLSHSANVLEVQEYEYEPKPAYRSYPVVRPRIGVGVGIGSHGVRGGVGVGFGIGIVDFGVGLGF